LLTLRAKSHHSFHTHDRCEAVALTR
jgi:hypothetical protein